MVSFVAALAARFYSGLFFHLRTTHVRVTPHRAILQIAGEGGSRPATSAYHPFF
jgi:hypothetical protein